MTPTLPACVHAVLVVFEDRNQKTYRQVAEALGISVKQAMARIDALKTHEFVRFVDGCYPNRHVITGAGLERLTGSSHSAPTDSDASMVRRALLARPMLQSVWAADDPTQCFFMQEGDKARAALERREAR